MSSKKNPLSRKDDIVVQELEGEVLIYDLRANKAFCLNETSALIWQACDGSKDIPQLSEFVGSRLNSKASEDLVWLALDQLKKEKLIENIHVSDGRFTGMSRRDVVKKIGLGTMIALPFVAGLNAPVAAHAASVCAGAMCGRTLACMTPCTCSTPSDPFNGSTCGTGIVEMSADSA